MTRRQRVPVSGGPDGPAHDDASKGARRELVDRRAGADLGGEPPDAAPLRRHRPARPGLGCRQRLAPLRAGAAPAAPADPAEPGTGPAVGRRDPRNATAADGAVAVLRRFRRWLVESRSGCGAWCTPSTARSTTFRKEERCPEQLCSRASSTTRTKRGTPAVGRRRSRRVVPADEGLVARRRRQGPHRVQPGARRPGAAARRRRADRRRPRSGAGPPAPRGHQPVLDANAEAYRGLAQICIDDKRFTADIGQSNDALVAYLRGVMTVYGLRSAEARG